MNLWKQYFDRQKKVIGMIHVEALPSTPLAHYSMQEIIERAVTDASVYAQADFDAIMIENMHDIPYLKHQVGPEIVAAMAVVGHAIRQVFPRPIGIQILAGANREALGAALAAGLDFIRAEGFVFGHVADEGYMDSCAGELLRYRKQINAEQIGVFTDIKKKHSSHAVTADVSIADTAKSAEFFLSDALIVTGPSTGTEPDVNELQAVRLASDLPLLIGSGISADNLPTYYPLADGFIIGSSMKYEGKWQNPVSDVQVSRFMEVWNRLKD